MNNKIIVSILFLSFTSSLFADREMERSEILVILKHLTSSPRRTWISQGTIDASLQSFNAITNRTTESIENIKYDGNRFCWEIITIPDKGPNTAQHNEPDTQLNEKRIFTWDGQWYNMYFKSAKRALSTDNLTNTPPTITGCLTAAVVPWGYGIYSYENLSGCILSATEIDSNENKTIQLFIKNPAGIELSMVLDPAKNYAALSSSISSQMSCTLQEYSNYVVRNNQWVPAVILIERYSDCQKTKRLISYDYWTFNQINAETPAGGVFDTVYENNTLIEYRPKSTEPLFCQYSPVINNKNLLDKKLTSLRNTDKSSRNCATSALKYVAESLGFNISDSSLAEMVNTADGETSLLSMRQFANDIGLQSLAIRTDIRSLNNTANYKSIIYLPWNKHYVVFSHIENGSVWVIDLANNEFCYRLPLEKFDSAAVQTPRGQANTIVLLISKNTINIQGEYTEILSQELENITGSVKYSCSELIQEYNVQFCEPGPIPLIPCWGMYTIWYDLLGCQEDINGGECISQDVIGSISSACIEDPLYPGNCILDGDWQPHYMRACR